MYSYLDAVYREAPASPSFDDGLYVNAVMDAAYRSDESRLWVPVEQY
jgi:predicted dehydrogenase